MLARQHEDDGPHLIYVPERVFDTARFVADVDAAYKRFGRCLVAVSEGIHDAAGKPILESKEVDSHGNVQLSGSGALGDFLAEKIKLELGSKLRVRADTFGYLQRSFAGVWSEVDASEAREVGRTAVRTALRGDVPHGSIVIERHGSGADYRAGFGCTELKNVAKETRDMPADFLAGANDVTPAFLDYARPLVGRMPRATRLSDFPICGAGS
jgi:6-phosphofructokinase 1